MSDKLPWMCHHVGCELKKLSTSNYCMSHIQLQSKEHRQASEPKADPKPLNKMTPRRTVQVNEYNKRVKQWRKGKVCVMCDWEGKKNPNVTNHHQQGREGDLLNDETKWIPLCIKHHEWATEHSKEAIELGISLPRNSKPTTI